MFEGELNLLSKIPGDNAPAQKRVLELARRLGEDNRQLLESYRAFGAGVRQTFDSVNQSLETLGVKHTRVYGMIGATLQNSLALEEKDAQASGAANMKKTQFAIGALKQLAPVKAAEAVAHGLSALAGLNFWSAANYFASAAMWGIVGASQVMGMVNAAGGGPSRHGAGARYHSGGHAGSGGEQWSYGAESTMAQTMAQGGATQSGNLTVAIMGDQQSGQWLATTLNRAVTQQGVQLVSTSSQRGAPVGH